MYVYIYRVLMYRCMYLPSTPAQQTAAELAGSHFTCCFTSTKLPACTSTKVQILTDGADAATAARTKAQMLTDTSTKVRQHLHLLRRTRRHRDSRCTPPPAATRAERRLRTLYRCPTASSARGKPDRRSCRPDRRKSCSRSRLRLLPRTASQAPRNSGNLQSRL